MDLFRELPAAALQCTQVFLLCLLFSPLFSPPPERGRAATSGRFREQRSALEQIGQSDQTQSSAGAEIRSGAPRYENPKWAEDPENPGWSLPVIHDLELSENHEEASVPRSPQPPPLPRPSTSTQSVGLHPEVSGEREDTRPSGFMEVSPGSHKRGMFAEVESRFRKPA